MTYQEKLRAFADYLDRHPSIARKLEGRYEYPSEIIYAENWEEFQTLTSDLGGFKKNGYAGTVEALHDGTRFMDDEAGTVYRVRVTVSGVCERKEKVDEEGNPVMRRKQTLVETDEMEPEYEWSCPEVWSR
jgi:hypothetical protein